MKTVTIFEKLTMQIKNLEIMDEQMKKGVDLSEVIHWQIEYLKELMSPLESHFNNYLNSDNSIPDIYADKIVSAETFEIHVEGGLENYFNNNSNDSEIHAYVDGGCRGNGKEDNTGAWAFTYNSDGVTYENYHGSYNTTNNIQELTACVEVLKDLKYSGLSQRDVTVNCDSAYVVNGINDWVIGWKKRGWKKAKGEILNLDLWKKLDGLKSEFDNVKFVKVKGHSDNKGNERADYLVNVTMDQMAEKESVENNMDNYYASMKNKDMDRW